MDAAVERKRFWRIFEEILTENGNPFSIAYMKNGKETSWADVNKNKALNENALDLSFLVTKKLLRINLYVRSGADSFLGRKILMAKEEIEKMISVPIIWENGTRNEKTLRPSYYLNIRPQFSGDYTEEYRRVIEESLPIIMEFIAVAKRYGERKFFDF